MPLAGMGALLVRAPAPFHLSGDDAMGVGIDFMVLTAASIASALVLGILLLADKLWHSRRDA